MQTLFGSPEVNGGWERNGGPEGNGSWEGNCGREVNQNPEGNHGPEGNRGPEKHCEHGRIEAGHFRSCNPKCPASIWPHQYFCGSMLFLVFFTVINMFVT